ncbi:GNAT family N-acetyltransferase [Flavobacterium sp. JP2137]|uniref:GNAT family N-acetyltransferase n=1 Tax=Flavobacterium sp. JP2137 TaxID=3414510 RepID=UPI003D2FD6F3
MMSVRNNTDSGVTFKAVDAQNIMRIEAFARTIWQQTYADMISQEQIDYMLNEMYSAARIESDIAAGYRWDLAFIGEALIGYLSYRLEDEQRVFLSKIYLDTRLQNRGNGRQLLHRVLDFAAHKQANAVYLTVNKNNAKAIAFYERNGFYIVKSQVFEIGQGYVMDDYIMQFDRT